MSGRVVFLNGFILTKQVRTIALDKIIRAKYVSFSGLSARRNNNTIRTNEIGFYIGGVFPECGQIFKLLVMEKTKVKVNYRVCDTGEIIAVFYEAKKNGKYACLSLYDNMHFDATRGYLRKCTKPAKGDNIAEFNASLSCYGYIPVFRERMKY